MILRDNIVRHIARQSYDVFKLGECNPTAIRLGDYSIALLIDAPESRKTLEFNINGLINHLKKRPYKFGENKFKFTISLGVVHLLGLGDSADTILNYAKAACEVAAEAEDNAYHIHEFDIKPESGSSAITEIQSDSGFDIDLIPEPVSVPSPSPVSVSNASITSVTPDIHPIQTNKPTEQVVAHKDLGRLELKKWSLLLTKTSPKTLQCLQQI